MKEFVWSGVIRTEYRDSFDCPLLEQPDGLKIDVLNAFKDVCESFPHKSVMVQYFITELPMTWDKVSEDWIKMVCGYARLEYEVCEGCPTCGPSYNTYFQIGRNGGHDLMREIWDHSKNGKYLNIKLTLQEDL